MVQEGKKKAGLLTDDEGCFSIILTQRKKGGGSVFGSFEIHYHTNDIRILKPINLFLGVAL